MSSAFQMSIAFFIISVLFRRRVSDLFLPSDVHSSAMICSGMRNGGLFPEITFHSGNEGWFEIHEVESQGHIGNVALGYLLYTRMDTSLIRKQVPILYVRAQKSCPGLSST